MFCILKADSLKSTAMTSGPDYDFRLDKLGNIDARYANNGLKKY